MTSIKCKIKYFYRHKFKKNIKDQIQNPKNFWDGQIKLNLNKICYETVQDFFLHCNFFKTYYIPVFLFSPGLPGFPFSSPNRLWRPSIIHRRVIRVSWQLNPSRLSMDRITKQCLMIAFHDLLSNFLPLTLPFLLREHGEHLVLGPSPLAGWEVLSLQPSPHLILLLQISVHSSLFCVEI